MIRYLLIIATIGLIFSLYMMTHPTLPKWLTGQQYTPHGEDDLIYLNNGE